MDLLPHDPFFRGGADQDAGRGGVHAGAEGGASCRAVHAPAEIPERGVGAEVLRQPADPRLRPLPVRAPGDAGSSYRIGRDAGPPAARDRGEREAGR